MRIAIVTGGPSAERGISLNSARSVYDHLDKKQYDITILYVNPRLEWFTIVPKQIYSNTPLDFDFQLQKNAAALQQQEWQDILQQQDLVFPLIHGAFGEDGQLQSILEGLGVPFVGSGSLACQQTANKFVCQQILRNQGFFTLDNCYILQKGEPLPAIPEGRRVVKPLHGGSSIGVHFFTSTEAVYKSIDSCFEQEDQVIIEPWMTGQEFTVIVLQNATKDPVALLPTQIGLQADTFFDYRKKYLATTDTAYHTPPLFDDTMIADIREQAQGVFTALGMKDVARLDGWILENGQIWFSDINAISGMEQNSFLFQQSSLLGWTHQQTLEYILHKSIDGTAVIQKNGSEIMPVVFGGDTAERQVSILSGTNVCMKLMQSSKYIPVPIILTKDKRLFSIPLHLCLYHTVEEIEQKIDIFQNNTTYQKILSYQQTITQLLQVQVGQSIGKLFVPQETTWEQLAKDHPFIFLGLHGGDGENGVLQKKLEELGVRFNGPDSEANMLCADKSVTKQHIDEAKLPNIRTARSTIIHIADDDQKIWSDIQNSIPVNKRIIKPIDDGCSAGVVAYESFEQLQKILALYRSDATYIPSKAIHPKHDRIELPTKKVQRLLVEEFIHTDKVNLENLDIVWQSVSDYIEVSVGVLGSKGSMQAFFPSQTIATQSVLSMEEKFMGGTGINLTPPPEPFVSTIAIQNAKKYIEQVAKVLALSGYSRIDTFMHVKTGELIVIEVNTLPALTPSTILFHQGLARLDPLLPLDLIEKIIEYGET